MMPHDGVIRSSIRSVTKDSRVTTKSNTRAVTVVNKGNYLIEVESEGGSVTLEPTESIVFGGHENYTRSEDLGITFGALFVVVPPVVNPKKLLVVFQDIILKPRS